MILITGGLGYIGSHMCVELLKHDYEIVIIDNLDNSSPDVFNKICKISNKKPKFYCFNLLDLNKIEQVFIENKIDGVIHFAGYKSVNESISKPLEYYENNIMSTINLLKLCDKYNVTKFIFSSSATVYGNSESPLYETSNTGNNITNPYGKTKYFIEDILKDFSSSNNKIKIISLRYFNPVGCHESGLIGDDPYNIPNNLMPYIIRVVVKNNIDMKYGECYNKLKIFGGDYNTEDGTCIRDFIHIYDLVTAHIKSYEYFDKMKENYDVYNVGTGKGTSVLELVETFKKVNKVKLPYEIVSRREGDCESVYCNCDKIKTNMNWKPVKSLRDICIDSYNYAYKSTVKLFT